MATFGSGTTYGSGVTYGSVPDDTVGDYSDWLPVVTMATANRIVFQNGGNIELPDDLTGWDDVVTAGWVEPTPSNLHPDPRPLPHPDWP